MAAKLKALADSDLGQAILKQIELIPELNQAHTGVRFDQGVVTLSGLVNSDAQRLAIEDSVKRVPGVEAIASDLRIKPWRDRPDSDIARDILGSFRNQILIPAHGITVLVRDGHVTLDGEVQSELQRVLAESAVKARRGITGISNQIAVTHMRRTTPENDYRPA